MRMEMALVNRVQSPSLPENPADLSQALLNEFFYATGSDLGILFCLDSSGHCNGMITKGLFDMDDPLDHGCPDWMDFILECRQPVVQNSRRTSYFSSGFLHDKMMSFLICPVPDGKEGFYILLLNSLRENHYGKHILKISEELTAKSIEVQRQIRQNKSHDSIAVTEK